jgi:hypothetical protein
MIAFDSVPVFAIKAQPLDPWKVAEMPFPAYGDEAHLNRTPLLVGPALFSAAADRTLTFRRCAVVILRLEHAAAARAGVPERESQERKLQVEVYRVTRPTEVNLPEIGRLNEKVDTQPTRKTWLVINTELAMIRILFIKGPCIQPGVDQ